MIEGKIIRVDRAKKVPDDFQYVFKDKEESEDKGDTEYKKEDEDLYDQHLLGNPRSSLN